MSRRREPVGPTISLFPFLAVLLCTMGALLVLLVLFSRSAQQADAQADAEAVRRRAEELELARDELGWRLDQLRGVRDRTADELAKARMQLAGIEDDARKLVDELDQIERMAAALESPEADGDADALRGVEERLAAARKSLEEARERAADKPPAYAVVPYEGPAGTHRRPLYIECCIDGVFLQPEGIRLGPGDFEGLPGPGNPLASALRAAREHLAGQVGESGDPGAQPYPLLLVRPSGVMAYYAARESLQSWGSDFGYQFVDEDWVLTYPPADPALAEAEQRAVEEARRRLEWLAQARPRPRSKPAVQYRASSARGGVVAVGGPSVLGDQSRWDWTEEQAAAGRGFRADGGESGGSGDAILGGGEGSGNVAGGLAGGAADGSGGTGSAASGAGAGSGDRYLGPSKFYGGADGGGPGLGASGGELAATDHPAGASGSGASAPGGGGGPADGGSASAPVGAGGEIAATGSGDASGGGGGGGDETGGRGGAGATAGGQGAGGAAGGTAMSGGGGGSFGPAPPGMGQGQASAAAGGGAAECSLAGRRGSNWASLASVDRPIPLTRPIRLECAGNEFRILGSGGRVTARVPIGTHTADAVDPLVRQVHAAVGDWGMAGDRMYWKPELVLSATTDGIGRRDELERLLADSGLDTRRAGQGDTVRSLPPVRTGSLPVAR